MEAGDGLLVKIDSRGFWKRFLDPDPVVLDALLSRLAPPAFLDIGADAGQYALRAALKGRDSGVEVYAAEPRSEATRFMAETAALNKLGNLYVFLSPMEAAEHAARRGFAVARINCGRFCGLVGDIVLEAGVERGAAVILEGGSYAELFEAERLLRLYGYSYAPVLESGGDSYRAVLVAKPS